MINLVQNCNRLTALVLKHIGTVQQVGVVLKRHTEGNFMQHEGFEHHISDFVLFLIKKPSYAITLPCFECIVKEKVCVAHVPMESVITVVYICLAYICLCLFTIVQTC